MSGFEFFARDIRVATEGLSQEATARELARFAREELRKAIASGEGSASFERFVNGRAGLTEDAVVPPGPIVYRFVNWEPVITAVLAELAKRGPRSKSGRFAASYIVIASGRLVTSYRDIKADDEVVVTNAQPYVRKAESGLLGVPRRRLFDGTRRAMARRYGEVFAFETKYLNIGSGVHPLIPYRLRRPQGGRKDRQAGSLLTYPSIVINMA